MFISRYNDREATLTSTTLRIEGERKGDMYRLNGLEITFWNDGTATAKKEHYRTTDPRHTLPNMTVEEGRITIELQDLAGLILERIPPEELARDLLCVEDVRSELLSGLAHRYSSDYISDENRRKFLRDIKEEIHDVALGHLVTKLNEIETGLRTKTSHLRWQKAQAHYYRQLWEYVQERFGEQPAWVARPSHIHDPDKLDASLQEAQDPIQLESVGPNWTESRNYWRKVLEERFPGPTEAEQVSPARQAISDFLDAWDAVPPGVYTQEALQDWLNGVDMKNAVHALRALKVNVTPPKVVTATVDAAAGFVTDGQPVDNSAAKAVLGMADAGITQANIANDVTPGTASPPVGSSDKDDLPF